MKLCNWLRSIWFVCVCASWHYNSFRGKPDTVMRDSLRNVVGRTRPYALPLTALLWTPNTRSAQHDQLCCLSFWKIDALSSAGQRHLYTAGDSSLNRLQAFYSTVTHPSTNHTRHCLTSVWSDGNRCFQCDMAVYIYIMNIYH
jgi:hypothetical protein